MRRGVLRGWDKVIRAFEHQPCGGSGDPHPWLVVGCNPMWSCCCGRSPARVLLLLGCWALSHGLVGIFEERGSQAGVGRVCLGRVNTCTLRCCPYHTIPYHVISIHATAVCMQPMAPGCQAVTVLSCDWGTTCTSAPLCCSMCYVLHRRVHHRHVCRT
jgi:hypothetical protein